MTRIIISNLQVPNSEENLLTELTIWQMRSVEGGIRRITKEDNSGMLSSENIKQTVSDWLANIDKQIVDLRNQLSV